MLSISPTPWRFNSVPSSDGRNGDIMSKDALGVPQGGWYVLSCHTSLPTGQNDAHAAVAAVNATYGNGLDPEVVGPVMSAVKTILRYKEVVEACSLGIENREPLLEALEALEELHLPV
jgi:hypothetical protein